MAYKHLFVDSDVLLDLALLREPFYPYIQLLLHEGEKQNVKLSTSGLIIANMNYILSKQLGAVRARKALKALRALVNVLSLDGEIIDLALTKAISPILKTRSNTILPEETIAMPSSPEI